ncbi:MAG: FtsK/SpoIIIE domain-containing protein [Thermoguttaceae bacterium]|jgi:energy-coupling factor transporter ATP-binding protein EcfA2
MMIETFSPDVPRQLLTDLCRLVRERTASEAEIHSGSLAGKEAADKRHQDSQNALASHFKEEKEVTEAEYAAAKKQIIAKFESETARVQKEYDSFHEQAIARFEAGRKNLDRQLQEGRWEVMAMSEAARSGSNLQLKEIVDGLESRWQELQTIRRQAEELLRGRGQWREFPEPQLEGLVLETDPARRFSRALDLTRTQYQTLSQQFMSRFFPRFFQGLWPLAIFLLLWAATVYPAALWFGWNNWHWAAVSCGAAFVVFIVIGVWLHRAVNRQAANAYLTLLGTLLEAGTNRPAVLEAAKAQCQQQFGDIITRQNAEMKKAEEKFAAATAEIERRKQHDVQQADTAFPPRLTEIAASRDRSLPALEEKYSRRLRNLDLRFTAESERLCAEHALAIRENEDRWRREWSNMSQGWLAGMERFRAGVEQLGLSCRELFPDWHTSDWNRWALPAEIPQAFQLGSSKLELAHIKDGLSADERLRPAQTEFALPVFLPFPQRSLLLWKANGPGLPKAVEAMQAVMLRLLTAMPPGKVRFTIIDPIGLGENFSAFMHLADYDEQLVANRIWTDTPHIEQRLADITKHMENVIQVYLRKEFPTIQQYNASAGELAEPYRVLVIANFPANFSETAALRLKSIVSSGARCGVFVLLSVDTKLPLSRHFRLADLEPDAMVLNWNQSQFVWEHADYGPLPVGLDTPPSADLFREIVRTVGDRARFSGRVEVPYSSIIPPGDQWWTADSSGGIDVPLGRAGALKMQNLKLGSGTSQHVLISGKTGSGKSTLLHVLITTLSLQYSPDEVELYLVDFKKGVEFKAYAQFALPHARVIAIESEREFGLSVLQRLDAELRTRGDMFRNQGVQDIKGYRAEQPDARLPRILLIIDEFQELFVEDDRIAQESALLLDRLVRQGRAFGIHVLLGSQTLGGAYSLARSTIGQMAVRIALQCSESDAHLILSEDNTAARLLTRPGEAIYNDANGLYEGNHPFQVVWLPDNERDEYLQQITHLAEKAAKKFTPPIVFEGNVLANPVDNPGLKEVLTAPSWPETGPAQQAWLGSAVAIKDPTSAAFIRQNGSNLLLVGHRDEAALGVISNCIVSLAAQHSPGDGKGDGGKDGGKGDIGAKFYILDGIRADAPEAGFWNRLKSALPHSVKIATPRDTADVLGEISAELALRQEQSETHGPPIYLVIFNLARFRDLRKEDEFSFSSIDGGKPPSPAKQFNTIVREGPALGIHTLLWCDSYNNVIRFLDRQNLRDFDMRVLFQMNATDSSSLMDTPDASRLGIHVAIFYDESQGRMEKFRPYGLPSNEWLAWVKKQLSSKTINHVQQ